jgi:hypothetical protein
VIETDTQSHASHSRRSMTARTSVCLPSPRFLFLWLKFYVLLLPVRTVPTYAACTGTEH